MHHRFTTLLAAGALAAGTFTLVAGTATAPSASAAVPSGPTAVAISSTGTTYAGTAAGGSLTRIDATGAVAAPVPLPRSGPVDGLSFSPDGNLWVSYGFGASKIDPGTGAELNYVDASFEPTTCPSSETDDPSIYGGIVASADNEIVLTHRCGPGIGLNVYRSNDAAGTGAFSARGGASAQLGGGRYGDLAYGPASDGQPGKAFYIAVPDAAKVEVRSGFDNVHGTPLRTIDIQAHGGGVTPRPVGVAVDDQGQLFVADAANHVIYVYNNGGTQYDRYIGNPPEPDSYSGGLDQPAAIAQYPRTGSIPDFQGNLFVADSGNDRVQRLNSYGYFFWSAPTDGSPSTPGSPPINTTLPTVTGTPSVGQTLTCDPGEWAGNPTFTFGWNRDNGYLQGETSQTYLVRSGDAGHRISCFVRGSNAAGTSDYRTSANVNVTSTPPAPSAPTSAIAPTIAGSPQPGATLTCSNGVWNGSPAPTYARQWQRDGVDVPGETSSTYAVQPGDLGSVLRCRVTATNTAGSNTASSAGVTVTATTPPTGCPGTANTVSIDAGSVYTTSAAVSLTIRPPMGATQVLISNDGGFDTAEVRSLATDCRYPWTLAVGGGTATKSVYVRFAGGGTSDATVGPTDDIVLDGAAPALPAPRITAANRKKTLFKVTLKASDKVSGVSRVQYAATKGARGTTVAYRGSFTTRKPAAFTWVRVYDRAGNVSAWKRAQRQR